MEQYFTIITRIIQGLLVMFISANGTNCPDTENVKIMLHPDVHLCGVKHQLEYWMMQGELRVPHVNITACFQPDFTVQITNTTHPKYWTFDLSSCATTDQQAGDVNWHNCTKKTNSKYEFQIQHQADTSNSKAWVRASLHPRNKTQNDVTKHLGFLPIIYKPVTTTYAISGHMENTTLLPHQKVSVHALNVQNELVTFCAGNILEINSLRINDHYVENSKDNCVSEKLNLDTQTVELSYKEKIGCMRESSFKINIYYVNTVWMYLLVIFGVPAGLALLFYGLRFVLTKPVQIAEARQMRVRRVNFKQPAARRASRAPGTSSDAKLPEPSQQTTTSYWTTTTTTSEWTQTTSTGTDATSSTST